MRPKIRKNPQNTNLTLEKETKARLAALASEDSRGSMTAEVEFLVRQEWERRHPTPPADAKVEAAAEALAKEAVQQVRSKRKPLHSSSK